MQLAAFKVPELVRVDDVAFIHGVSHPHIVKVVYALGKAGYLETVRGRQGGFRLSRPADEIIVSDVVRLTKGPLEVVECFNPEKNTCPLIGICKLSTKIQEATHAFMDVLDNVTMADISANRIPLLERIELLEITGKPATFAKSEDIS